MTLAKPFGNLTKVNFVPVSKSEIIEEKFNRKLAKQSEDYNQIIKSMQNSVEKVVDLADVRSQLDEITPPEPEPVDSKPELTIDDILDNQEITDKLTREIMKKLPPMGGHVEKQKDVTKYTSVTSAIYQIKAKDLIKGINIFGVNNVGQDARVYLPEGIDPTKLVSIKNEMVGYNVNVIVGTAEYLDVNTTGDDLLINVDGDKLLVR